MNRSVTRRVVLGCLGILPFCWPPLSLAAKEPRAGLPRIDEELIVVNGWILKRSDRDSERP